LAAAAFVAFVIANSGNWQQPPKPTSRDVILPPPSAPGGNPDFGNPVTKQEVPPRAQVPQMPSGKSMPSLNLSYRNDAVQVQRRLIALGFLKGFFADGNWGSTSQQALVEFKKQSGLGSGGNWDSTTQRILFSDQAVHARSAN
jgi:hypothetical protein